MASIYDFEATNIDGKAVRLDAYRDHVVLVVNVASKCGFTPQYAALESLYRQHQGAGFSVLGFPCDQFGHQEPGNEAEIKNFCSLNYNVSFPLFAKIQVNGPHTHPLYKYLKSARSGFLWTRAIKWNFTKFLVDRQGRAVRRYAPTALGALERGVASLLKG
jgi:glutathione peroxidase